MPKVGEPMATYCKWLKKKFECSLIYQFFLLFFLLPKNYMWPSQCKSIGHPDKLDKKGHIWNSAGGNGTVEQYMHLATDGPNKWRVRRGELNRKNKKNLIGYH